MRFCPCYPYCLNRSYAQIYQLRPVKTFDQGLARDLIRAIRDQANARAWQTPRLVKRSQGDAVRKLAAVALVEALMRWHEDDLLVADLTTALVVVAHRDTEGLMAVARKRFGSALPDTLEKAIIRIERRLAKG